MTTNNKKHIGYVYKIVIDDVNVIYIGSCKDIKRRQYDHKCAMNIYPERLVYKKMIELGINKDNFCKRFEMICLEEVEYDERYELKAVEKKWIEELKTPCNKKIPYHVCKKEGDKLYQKRYCEKNREKLKQYAKDYYYNNKERLQKERKEDYQKNKEKYCLLSRNYYYKNKDKIQANNRIKAKEYYHNNKKRKLDYAKIYYEKNYEKVREYQKNYRNKINKK